MSDCDAGGDEAAKRLGERQVLPHEAHRDDLAIGDRDGPRVDEGLEDLLHELRMSPGAVADIVAALPSLCAPSALVLWTRHRRPPDLTPAIRSWFREAGFREEAFDVSPDGFMSVGAHRLTGEPAALVPGQRLFTFVAGT